MTAFHETIYGKRFFDSQLPKLIKELGRIADALEKQNEPIIVEQEENENEIEEIFDEVEKVLDLNYNPTFTDDVGPHYLDKLDDDIAILKKKYIK